MCYIIKKTKSFPKTHTNACTHRSTVIQLQGCLAQELSVIFKKQVLSFFLLCCLPHFILVPLMVAIWLKLYQISHADPTM